MMGATQRQLGAFSSSRLDGEVLLLPKVGHSVLTVAVVLWCAAMGVWLFGAEITKRETVVGWLEPVEGVARIPAQGSGIVRDVYVTEGEAVVEDQPLIFIDGAKSLSDGGLLEERLISEYKLQESMSKAQIERTHLEYERRETSLEEKIGSATKSLALVQSQRDAIEVRLEIMTQQVERLEGLRESALIAQAELDRARNEQLTLRGSLTSLNVEIERWEQELRELEVERALLPSQRQESIAALAERVSEVRQQMSQVLGQRGFVLRASRSGLITNLRAKAGQYVTSTGQDVLVTIVPSDGEMLAHLVVSARAAGSVEVGQTVRITYDAFPESDYGATLGQVMSISSTIVLPSDLESAPIGVSEAVFLVVAKLQAQYVERGAQRLSLRSGMTLSADIELSRQSLLEWLIGPLRTLSSSI